MSVCQACGKGIIVDIKDRGIPGVCPVCGAIEINNGIGEFKKEFKEFKKKMNKELDKNIIFVIEWHDWEEGGFKGAYRTLKEMQDNAIEVDETYFKYNLKTHNKQEINIDGTKYKG